jgi:protease IV
VIRFLIGFLATLGALAVVVVIVVAALVWSLLTPAPPELPERVVLRLDLRQGLAEMPGGDPLAALGLRPEITLTEAVMALERAAADPRVHGVVARLGGEGPRLAQAQELRAAIARLREAGKFTLAHADSFGEFGPGTRGYYLASGFEEIHLQPMGAIGLTGLLIETPLLRELLDNLGVLPSGDKRGTYKSLAETFTESELTPWNREALEALADSVIAQIADGIAAGRGLGGDAVRALIDRGPFMANEALDAGLVDGLSYFDEVAEQALTRAGPGAGDVGLTRYLLALGPPPQDAPVVALIHGVGRIQRGESDYGPAGGWVMGADTVADALTQASEDPEVQAILFRVDSGGGSAVASETIGRAVRRAVAAGKPVIVSMADMAASGGYWIAMDASTIVARPATLTGSIGVFAGKPVLAGFWDHIGVNWGRVQRGANADMWSTGLDFDESGRERLDAFLDHTYAAFIAGVARGRELPEEQARAAAEGRVWTGAQALELGLVDDLGGLPRALALAREAAGVAPDAPIALRPYPPPRTPFEQALDLFRPSPLGLDALAGRLRGLATPGTLAAPPLVIR